jgi:hypothetical protein
MGRGVSICCEACCANEDILLGVGMSIPPLFDDPFDILQRYVDKPRRDRILDKLRSNQFVSVSAVNNLYICEACGKPTSRQTITVTQDNELVYESQFRCGKCRKKITCVESGAEWKIIEDILKGPCWKCGQKELVECATIMWD